MSSKSRFGRERADDDYAKVKREGQAAIDYMLDGLTRMAKTDPEKAACLAHSFKQDMPGPEVPRISNYIGTRLDDLIAAGNVSQCALDAFADGIAAAADRAFSELTEDSNE